MATATKTRSVHAAKSTKRAVAVPSPKKLRPPGDRVVVWPTPGEETTKSGIVIPDTAKEKPQEGVVVAVGPGRVLDDGNQLLDALELQRITELIWWYRHSGTHSAEPLRLGKQTLCQLSYSRSVSRSVTASA